MWICDVAPTQASSGLEMTPALPDDTERPHRGPGAAFLTTVNLDFSSDRGHSVALLIDKSNSIRYLRVLPIAASAWTGAAPFFSPISPSAHHPHGHDWFDRGLGAHDAALHFIALFLRTSNSAIAIEPYTAPVGATWMTRRQLPRPASCRALPT